MREGFLKQSTKQTTRRGAPAFRRFAAFSAAALVFLACASSYNRPLVSRGARSNCVSSTDSASSSSAPARRG